MERKIKDMSLNELIEKMRYERDLWFDAEDHEKCVNHGNNLRILATEMSRRMKMYKKMLDHINLRALKE